MTDKERAGRVRTTRIRLWFSLLRLLWPPLRMCNASAIQAIVYIVLWAILKPHSTGGVIDV